MSGKSPKRRKMEDALTDKGKGCFLTDEKEMKLAPVLSDHVTAPIPQVTVYAAAIMDKKKTSGILRRLSSVFPLEELTHIKRVRKQISSGGENGKGGLEVILCEASKVTLPPGCQEILLDHILPDHVHGDFKDQLSLPFLASVARRPPQTRQQYEEANRHWPTTFHEDKELSHLISGKNFSDADRDQIKNHLKEILEMTVESLSEKDRTVACDIVDPKTDTILAKTLDCQDRRESPLQHAVMKCIDLVAHSQGGGAWSLSTNDSFMPAEIKYSESSNMPYLCTGYDLYVSQEPCIMCAMALVHSRVRRVFYIYPHSDGALGSKYKLHTEQGINHRFQVFQATFTENQGVD